ncbi:MAG TPA: IS110 family transposase [Bradyrhizobium sp.]|nr:IS110 family transposase [Bradyrhizobium sp.]
MDILHERVAGLDVHQATIVACVRRMDGAKVRRQCRSFATTTAGLLDLLAWLRACGCSHVAMEATGVYWKPVWNILSDGNFVLIVANAAHIKNVPGRKTDMNDAMWIADLAACGLLKASFVPAESLQELRSLMRTRKQLSREQTRHVQRIQKTLEQANIKLSTVICDVLGVNGRRMIEAMIAGVDDPGQLAGLADRRLKASAAELYEALHGRLTDHHRFLLQLHLGQYDALDLAIARIDRQVDAAVAKLDEEVADGQAPFRHLIALLCTIPGVSVLAATTILAEIGRDMSRFATAGHLLAWAGLCPGQNESAGKRKPVRLRHGSPWLKTMLVQCAWAAKRKKDSYYRAQFHRLSGRRGPQKAICAVAAALLTAIYHMLKDGTAHHDLGADHFDRRPPQVRVKQLVARLAKLGYQVQLQPLPQAA